MNRQEEIIPERRFLYRGVSKDLHKRNKGELIPKGKQFKSQLYPSEYLFPSEKLIIGENEHNAVIMHQVGNNIDAGISTTPVFERAKFYATHVFIDSLTIPCEGYVYFIDRKQFLKLGITEYVVAEIYDCPKIPEDEEVILVAKDRGILPSEIITKRCDVTV